ncbi:MAG: response regulator [Pseudomonadota bacterium]
MKIFMLIDDSPVIRKVANRILSDVGFVVVESDDGLDALNKCREDIPDAIIVDWDLPSMTGIEFIEEFVRLPGSENTRILYCTSEIMVSDMTKAKRAGCHAFLMKPFNREILLHKIKEAGVVLDEPAAA